MKRYFAVLLGILTAIGGFVDIGDLVTNAQVGARLGLSLAWIIPVGVVGICVFAEMSGRIAAVSRRATFDLIRERLGPRIGFLNLVGSMLVTLLTFIAEIGGVALALQLVSSVHHLLIVPFVAVAVWVVLWRAKFSSIENVLGLMGLALIAFAVALWQLGPDWGELVHQLSPAEKPAAESWATYAYFAVALFGAAMTPYEVFFFSSGGVEERWTVKDIGVMRANVFIGFPLGGLLSVAIAACAATVFLPVGVSVETLGQVGLPVAIGLGKIGLAVVVLGFFAATFGAACETGLSTGYSLAQYFGFPWGKFVRPKEAAGFHLILLVATAVAAGVLLTGVDPIMVTEMSVVFSAIALPLTYFPILVVANDPDYLGEHVNGPVANALGVCYLVVITIAALAAIPLMILTSMGQG
ncbi:NRAMP family divalent metal transporter [Nocardioides nitrophenolicus]|uniref:NRAMP family divalent metal transporter n=1 Tax=Nocardioides nitrophenolicus TaxID=60489 RepID=UPI00195D67A9|nr:divalent metal cation transporter [Nocardioides nitrophenolicus]MBM7516362.1 Mn2+/Fe2+ NRAMP family transporter [Nocardioides nitrophenolicus]